MNQILDPGKLMKAAPTVQLISPVLTPEMLRDWFACAIAQGMAVCGEGENIYNWDAWAADVYKGADALMKARVVKE